MNVKKQKNQYSILNVITKFCGRVNAFSERLNSSSNKFAELAVLLLYGVFHCVVSFQHEASFDEAHAWNIARDASVYSTLFEVPHCEGHPSLWHLILMPFAKSGADYTISMLLITLIFTMIAVYLLEFKSKFPRLIKLFLPFTYFFFYQYGIVARPYCMMLAAFMLLAHLHGTRDEKPGRFTLTLIFLCSTSAFGTVFVCGFAIVWVWHILREYWTGANKRQFIKDRRVLWLVVLVIYALTLFYRALPWDNVYGALNYNGEHVNGVGARLVYLFLAIISDLFFTTSYTNDFLADYNFTAFELIGACIVGTAIIGLIVYIGKKYGTLFEFLVPFTLFGVFSVIVYFCVHNSGLPFLLIVFWAWITYEKKSEMSDAGIQSLNEGVGRPKYLLVLCLAGMILPLVWSVSSAIIDYNSSYTIGRREAEFILDNGLDEYDICVEWNEVSDINKADVLEGYDLKHNIDMDRLAVYIDDISLVNWPMDYSLFPFYHTITTSEENSSIMRSLRKNPYPSVLIGEPKLSMLDEDYTGEELENERLIAENYTEVYRDRTVKPWKGLKSFESSVIYVRNDLVR